MRAIGFYIDSKIGDSVVALPAIYTLKHIHPHARLYIFCNSITQNLYAPFEWIEKCILIQKDIIHSINHYNLDFLISSNADKNTIEYLKKSNVPTIYTFLKPYNIFDSRLKLLFANLITKPQSIRKTLIDLVQLTQDKKNKKNTNLSYPHLKTFPQNVQKIDHFLQNIDPTKKLIMLNPFGYAAKVNLSLEEYAQVAQSLLGQYNVILPTFKDKHELVLHTFAKSILSHRNFYLFHNDEDLLNLVELISRMDLLISPSTGNIHIAENLGIASIGIFSLKDTILWGGNNIHYLINPKNPQKTLSKILNLTQTLLSKKV